MSQSKSIEIKKTLIESAVASSCHGLPNIFKNERILSKVMWTLFFLASWSYCLYSIIKSINAYLNWDVITNIDIIQEIPAEFPAVTICNLNAFASDYGRDYLNGFDNVPNSSSNFLKFYGQMIAMGKNVSDEDRKNFSLPLKDFLLQCRFGGAGESCTENDFDWHYNEVFGNCYTFNNGRDAKGETKDIRNSTRTGYISGLKLILFLGNFSESHRVNERSGVHVYVHHKDIKLKFDEGIDVSSGEATNIVINKLINTKLGHPYNKCFSNLTNINSFDSEFYRAIIQSNKTYTQKECFDVCLQNEFLESCNCSFPFFINFKNKPNCESISDFLCISQVYPSLYKYVNTKCLQHCPENCETIDYRITASHSQFPNPNYANSYLKNYSTLQPYFQPESELNSRIEIDNDLLKKSLALINIFYEDLKYTKVSQIAKMNFEDLLSNVGGTLGLFIGISFLSIIEVFDLLLQVMFILVGKRDLLTPRLHFVTPVSK